MAKSKETYNKRQKEMKKQQARKDKEQKKLDRKANNNKGKSLDDMLAYLDENGNIISAPNASNGNS